jgi:hypothetical protein
MIPGPQAVVLRR